MALQPGQRHSLLHPSVPRTPPRRTACARLDLGGTLLTGSHLDTVPFGGKFDGALGVLALQALREQAGQPRRSLEVVALCEEEGSRFQAHYWGTRAMLGSIEADELERLRDEGGMSIAQAMRDAGLAPERYREAVRGDLEAFLELHIEQGRDADALRDNRARAGAGACERDHAPDLRCKLEGHAQRSRA